MTVLSKAPPGSKSQDSPRGQVLHTTCEMQALTPWGNRRGPLRGLFLSEPVSRILSGAAIHLCGPPGPRRAGSTVLFGLAPGGVCQARPRHRGSGALLPHPFTLACARLTCGRAIGGLLSAALSRGFPRVSVTHRPCPVVPGLSSKASTSATA